MARAGWMRGAGHRQRPGHRPGDRVALCPRGRDGGGGGSLPRRACRPWPQEIRAAGGKADAFRADLREPEQSAAMVARVVERFGRLDVLVNNAGVVRVRPLLDTDAGGLGLHQRRQCPRSVLRAAGGRAPDAAAGARGCGPPARQDHQRRLHRRAASGGRCSPPTRPARRRPSASRSRRRMALAPQVTVNAICPGVVDTEMWRQIDSEWTEVDQRPPGSAWQDRIRGIPLGRPETPEDLTGMAAFLASADSDYITGQSFHVDGGLGHAVTA